ncbi:MAG: zinc metallopeptidase [Clostridia bacterium]
MYYGSGDSIYLVLLLVVMILSFAAQGKVQRTFQKYAKLPVSSGKSADCVAQELLNNNNSSVQIMPVEGTLTDHFNPKTNVVGLSTQVYGSNSIAAVAVAAHEIGHVMQYESNYMPIRLRNAILPVAAIGSQAAPWIIILGIVLGSYRFALAGVILFGAMLLFQVVTLPVEFNASARGLRMLEEGNYISYEESDGAKKVLQAAAMTYVLAAISALISFLRLLSIAQRSRRD